jgi:WD40 repeat protein
MQLLKGHRSAVRSLAFAGEGRYLASCAGRGTSVWLWNLANGKCAYLKGHQSPVVRVVASRQGYRLASEAPGSSEVLLWALDAGVPTSPQDEEPRWGHTTFNADGSLLASVAANPFKLGEIGVDFEPLQEEVRFRSVSIVASAAITATAWSPDGDTFAVALSRRSNVGELFLIHLDRDAALTGPISLANLGRHLAFSPDSQSLAVHTAWQLSLHDPATGEIVGAPVPSSGWVRGMTFLEGGRILTAEILQGTGHTRICDAGSGKYTDDRDWQIGPLSALAVAPDGMRAAVGSESGQILVFDLD